MAPVCVGDGANHGQAADPVEQVVADHQGRTAALLLMAGLGIKVQIDDITLFKNRHHASEPSAFPQSSSSASIRSIWSMGFP